MADPFWLQRARGQTGNPVIDQMYLEHPETGYPQTIYSASHPMGQPPSAPAMLYPTIRWRTPGLERLTEDAARDEAMSLMDYLLFSNLGEAEKYAKGLSKSIRRKKKKRKKKK